MRRTTPAQPASLSPAFPTIDPTTLRDVQGGCGKKCTCAPQPAPQAAPAPMGPEVSTSVSISYQ